MVIRLFLGQLHRTTGSPCEPSSGYAFLPKAHGKVNKLKRDSFWPVLFELAMAYRLKKMVEPSLGSVRLSCEDSEAVGDFSIVLDEGRFAAECTRLGFPPEARDQYQLLDETYRYIESAFKVLNQACCIKIRMEECLTGPAYNRLLVRLKKAIGRFKHTGLTSADADATISVTVEPLTPGTEEIPFELIDNRVMDVKGTDWTSALSICRAPAKNDRELATKFRLGDPLNETERARILVRFPRREVEADQYDRIVGRIRRKISQTKIPPSFGGRIVFLEWPFDLRGADLQRLDDEMLQQLKRSEHTIAVVLARREANPHYRHHYSAYHFADAQRLSSTPVPASVFRSFSKYDTIFDPVLNEPYQFSWEAAREKVLRDHAEAEERKNRL